MIDWDDDWQEEWREELGELIAEVKQARDETRVQAALAEMETRDDWNELEKQWERFSDQLKRASGEAADAGEDVGGALSLLGEELKQGYTRIRKALSD